MEFTTATTISKMISTADNIARVFDASPKGSDTLFIEQHFRWDDTHNAKRINAGDVVAVKSTQKASKDVADPVIAFGVVESKSEIDFTDIKGADWVASHRRYGVRYVFSDVAFIKYSELSDDLKRIVNLPGQGIAYA